LGIGRARLRALRGFSPRQWVAVGVQGALLLALAPAFLMAGHSSFTAAPVLFVSLAALAVIGEAREVRLASGVSLDATTACGLIALVAGGPLVAFVVMVVPIVAYSTVVWWIPAVAVERKRLFRLGNLSNVASYGWSLLLAWALLGTAWAHGAGVAQLPLIFLAGVVASASQLALGPCVHETLFNGYRLREILGPAWLASSADLAMTALGATTVVLLGILGNLALLPFVAMMLLPTLVSAAAKARSLNGLSHAGALALYTPALAAALGLSRHERRQIPLVMGGARMLQASGVRRDVEASRLLHASDLKELLRTLSPTGFAAWSVSDPWHDRGRSGDRASLLAQIVAVAEHWAALTADDGARLSHAQAMAELAALAGSRYDPSVVAAAQMIVAREQRFSSAPAFRPWVVRLRVAPQLRAAALPAH
jgi:hypothetical protein